MKFKIEQLAIRPQDPQAARELLEAMGLGQWVEDTVAATGWVDGELMKNEANLSFNYEAFAGKEFELLDYVGGPNWIDARRTKIGDKRISTVSHLGMHVTHEELAEWSRFFARRGISIAQEVFTDSHTNPSIKDTRRYHYVIFDTQAILGVDIKLIVRMDVGKQGALNLEPDGQNDF
jgi:hypothetical protein